MSLPGRVESLSEKDSAPYARTTQGKTQGKITTRSVSEALRTSPHSRLGL
jgi:hypothetical protein